MLDHVLIQITFVIFREFLEIALLLSIIIASTYKIKSAGIYITMGAMLGVCGAFLIAFFTQFISESLDGMGQEIFNAAILMATSLLLICTICIMQNHKSLINNINHLAENIDKSLLYRIMLVGIVAGSIFREGAEIMLFLYSIISVNKIDVYNYLLSILIASSLGIASGVLLYKGLMRFAGKYIFKVSLVLFSMIAASLFAESLKILISCDIITANAEPIFHLGSIISEYSILGVVFKILIGYNGAMTQIELFGYLGVILFIVSFITISNRRKNYQKTNKN